MKGFKQERNKPKNKKKISISSEKLLQDALRFHAMNQIKDAQKNYELLIKINSINTNILNNLAIIYKGQNRIQEAQKLLETAINDYPRSADAYFYLSNLLIDQGYLEDAEKIGLKGIELNPSSPIAQNNLGIVFYIQKKYIEAEKYFKKSIEINTNNSNAYFHLAKIYIQKGDIQMALNFIRKANQSNQKNIDIKNELISILIKTEIPENILEAEKIAKETIKIHPNESSIYILHAAVLNEQKRYQESLISINKAIEIKPNIANYHGNLGVVNRELGNLKESEVNFKVALNMKANNYSFDFRLVEVLMDQNKKEEAFNKLLSLSKKEINDGLALRTQIEIAIILILENKVEELQQCLIRCEELITKGALKKIPTKINQKYVRGYYEFISKLINKLKDARYEDNSNHNKIMHVGESHCLSFAHQIIKFNSNEFQIIPILVQGAKAWHLGSESKNRFNSSFITKINASQPAKHILISFGEIDCRQNEGILNFSNKYNKEIKNVAKETIIKYLNFMESKLKSKFENRHYFGVPAPTIKTNSNLFTQKEKDRIDLIKFFNASLEKECASRKLSYIDIYKLTKNNQGTNNRFHMIDDLHLSPSSLKQLMEDGL